MVSDFARYHIQQAIRAALAESNEDYENAEHLRAQGNLRLMVMGEEELRDVALLLSHPPTRYPEDVYQELKCVIEERRGNTGAWLPVLCGRLRK